MEYKYSLTRDKEGKDVVMRLTADELYELLVEDSENQQMLEDADLYCEHDDTGDRI